MSQQTEMRIHDVPNLDAMEQEELMSFWAKHQKGRCSAELFGKTHGKARLVTGDIANYASNKATAMACRLRGDILGAMTYEGICERIYERLPDWARW